MPWASSEFILDRLQQEGELLLQPPGRRSQQLPVTCCSRLCLWPLPALFQCSQSSLELWSALIQSLICARTHRGSVPETISTIAILGTIVVSNTSDVGWEDMGLNSHCTEAHWGQSLFFMSNFTDVLS